MNLLDSRAGLTKIESSSSGPGEWEGGNEFGAAHQKDAGCNRFDSSMILLLST